MKFVIAILTVIVAILAWRLVVELRDKQRYQDQIRGLEQKLTDKSDREAFDSQEKCSVQADQIFRSTKLYGAHRGHYNRTLKKCLLAMETIAEGATAQIFTKVLMDPYDRHQYAEFSEVYPNPEVGHKPPYSCKLFYPTYRRCVSSQEYEAYVAVYMEQNAER